jgi:hypothetical protein
MSIRRKGCDKREGRLVKKVREKHPLVSLNPVVTLDLVLYVLDYK